MNNLEAVRVAWDESDVSCVGRPAETAVPAPLSLGIGLHVANQ